MSIVVRTRRVNVRIEVPGILEETNFGFFNDPRWKGPYQELFLHFKIPRIVSPDHLRLRER